MMAVLVNLRAAMLKKRLHSLTSIYLAVLYGLVGLTGESLHYLVTDPTILLPGGQSLETSGYYHAHAPDNHWHFHRQVDDARSSHDRKVTSREVPHGTTIAPERCAHEPHACPLLSVISSLKLGHADGCSTWIPPDTFVTLRCEGGISPAFDVAFFSCARGPPTGICA